MELDERRSSDESGSTETEKRAREELRVKGVLDTALGQAAVALAHRLDHPGEDSGSSLAAVRRDFAKAMADALRDAEDVDDNVTNIRSFRSRRRAQAT